MTSTDQKESPLESLAAGKTATDAFELLSDETRLAILAALWERYEPFSDDATVRFSELRERVGAVDSGQFNYHLDRLTDHFVDATDGGYRLAEPGLKLVRAVIAGAGIEDPTLEPTEIDVTCTLCGADVAVAYDDGHVYLSCTECDGLWTEDDRSGGHLGKFSLDPAGLTDRSPEDVYAAGCVSTFQQLSNMLDGVCPTCSGPVERSLSVCDDHAPDGLCPNCDRRAEVVARLACPVCKEWIQSSPGGVAKHHPAVVGFCHGHGLDLQYDVDDVEAIERRLEVPATETELLAEDPPRVAVTTEIDGDAIRVELDADLRVVAVER